ncbi:MAG: YfhO family protein [Candidatus Obscuribacterales bacterium]|nr:YfhO family protein [Candidatus Obscuribacterales bacterium]
MKSMTSPTLKNERIAWIMAFVVILLCNFVVFRKTILHHANISVSSHLTKMDSCFNPTLPSGHLGVVYDPTPYTMLNPDQAIVKRNAAKGQLPLWNDLDACGIPILGDFAAFVFSPHTWLFAYASAWGYNLILCGMVLLGCLGTLVFSRYVGLSAVAAVFAAIAFGFCPGCIRYTELPNQVFLIPWIVWAIVALGARSFWKSVAAGVVSGLCVYGMHAECALGAVGMAWAYLMVFTICESALPLKQALLRFFSSLGIAVVSGVCVAIPVILPFLEFFGNSICYKSVVSWSRFAPWYALDLCFVHPCSGGVSLFAGILLLPLAVLGVMSKQKHTKTILAAFLINFLVVSKFPPLNLIMNMRPFNFFMPIYAAPSIIFFLALLAGFGVGHLFKASHKQKIAVAFFTILCAAVPFILLSLNVKVWNWQFDAEATGIDLREGFLQSILASIFALTLCLLPNWTSKTKQLLLSIGLIAINAFSMSGTIKLALPTMPPCWYPKTDMIEFLMAHPGRIVGLGEHLLIPSVNAMYGISDFRSQNVMVPARYFNFMKQAGAELRELCVYVFNSKLGKEIDLASVKYVIAQHPSEIGLDPKRFKLVKNCNGYINVYENLQALPEAYMVHNVISADSPEKALHIISSPEFNPQTDAVVESKLNLQKPMNGTVWTPSVKVERVNPNKIDIKVSTKSPGVLILTDTYFPGWEMTVDGHSQEILPANGMFRGAALDAGQHDVVFSYRPRSFEKGLMIFGGFSAVLLLLLVFMPRRKKPSSTDSAAAASELSTAIAP